MYIFFNPEDTQHVVEYNVDYVGNDINDGENIPRPLITSSAYDCGVECAKEPNCVGFSWSDMERSGFEGNCWMKSSMPEDTKIAMEHVVSGFKPEVNCNFVFQISITYLFICLFTFPAICLLFT